MYQRFSEYTERRSSFYKLAIATIILNVMQLGVGFFRNAFNANSIRIAAQDDSYFSWLIFSSQCVAQKSYLIEVSTKTFVSKSVLVGIFPMFFAETAVMFIVLAFAGMTIYFTRHATVNQQAAQWGIGLAVLLFVIDQGRYAYTSIIDVTKRFFTWSSYCVHGDIGWLFDALAYVAMYGTTAICIAAFVASLIELQTKNLDPAAPYFGKREAFFAVESTFSWLSYFGYAFLVIWVVFSGITPEASRVYALQAVVIFIIIFGFYFSVLFRYLQVSLWHQERLLSSSKKIAANPVVEFTAPHGTKLVQTFIKLALPIIFFLSVWFEWIKPLAVLSGAQ